MRDRASQNWAQVCGTQHSPHFSWAHASRTTAHMEPQTHKSRSLISKVRNQNFSSDALWTPLFKHLLQEDRTGVGVVEYKEQSRPILS
jgi:hypothetical protein